MGFPGVVFLLEVSLLAALGAVAQAPGGSAAPVGKQLPEREVVVEGLVSYGNYSIFATDDMSNIYTADVEYDRHSWGRALGARRDYVAEVLPVVLFNQWANTDIYGNPLNQYGNGQAASSARRTIYGIGLSPIGLRMMWRDNKDIKPYLLFKGGMLLFDHKAISDHAAYENFSMQS